MSNVLITGATGFLGQAITRRLLTEGHNCVAIVRDERVDSPCLAENMVVGDICNLDLVRRTISDYEIDHIYHLASQAIVRVCAADPLSAYQVNVMGTVNVMEAARIVGGVKSILVSTSDKAYGHAAPPYTEDTPLWPKYTYEATKTCQDIVAQNYFHNYDVPTKVARCSNIYGPGDPNRSRLVPATIARVARGETPKIYADVLEYVREFVYIDDVVDAFTLIQNEAKPGEIYCVGGVGQVRVREMIQKILDVMESELEIEVLPKQDSRFKEIEAQWIDGSKLNRLGWQPRYDLDAGIRATVEWHRGD